MLNRYRNHTTRFALGLAVVLSGSSLSLAAPGGNGGGGPPTNNSGMDTEVALINAAFTSFQATVSAPAAGTASCDRSENGATTPENYVVEQGSGMIRFMDSTTGLGDNGVTQTDEFVITTDHATAKIAVVIKANTDTSSVIKLCGVGNTVLASNYDPLNPNEHPNTLGFDLVLKSFDPSTNQAVVAVTSNGAPYALSHITFAVGAGAPNTPENCD